MLQAQSVLITGCSTGIGRALALELAKRGHTVYATARRPETLDDIASANLIPLALDVLDPDSAAKAIATVIEKSGRLDMLINNAGVSNTAPLVEAPLDRLKGIVDTNLTAVIAMIQAVFPTMADQGHGRIVNVGSVVGVLPTPFTATYCASKAAVHMLSDTLRMELHPFNIDVIEVQPAAVRTEIEDRAAEGMDAFKDEKSRYRPYFEGIKARFEGPKKKPFTAEQFAELTADQIMQAKAPRIVRGGGESKLLHTLAKLPTAIREPMFIKEYGLSRKS